MINIRKPIIKSTNSKVRIICDVEVDGEVRQIWFEVDEEYGKYLCEDRADAYIIGLLSWAMRNNHDIYCDTPVTEELLYQINEILIPSLVKHSSGLNRIRVVAECAPYIKEGNSVGTGVSCGVDSFWSIMNHMNTNYNDMDLTHLCINNVGAFNQCYSDYGEEKVKNERYQISEEVSRKLGLPLIETDSNFAEAFEQNHLLTSTYSCCFAIYMLQKLWKTYYLASNGIDYGIFTLKDNDNRPAEQSELFVLQCLSTPGLKIYCDGGGKTRYEKTSDIVDYSFAQKYLHVCTTKSYNCGICSKCRRTLVSIDLLNKLEEYKDVFDIDYYKKHKKDYYKWLSFMHYKKDLMNEPVYQGMLERKEFRKYKNSILGSVIKYELKRKCPNTLKEYIKKKK